MRCIPHMCAEFRYLAISANLKHSMTDTMAPTHLGLLTITLKAGATNTSSYMVCTVVRSVSHISNAVKHKYCIFSHIFARFHNIKCI